VSDLAETNPYQVDIDAMLKVFGFTDGMKLRGYTLHTIANCIEMFFECCPGKLQAFTLPVYPARIGGFDHE